MNRDQAEAVALQALAFIAGRDDLFSGFLGATGASLADLRGRAGDPAFLGAVLDYLMLDDAWIMGFSDETGQPPTAPASARAALPGGIQIAWT